MQNIRIKIIYVFFLLFIFSGNTYSQKFLKDTLASYSHSHTPWDILSGDSHESIVCYKQTHRNIYLLVTGLIVIIAIVAIKLLSLNRKANKLLKERNELIEAKNKDITDSINYAKRIQRSLLPTEKYIEKKLNRIKN